MWKKMMFIILLGVIGATLFGNGDDLSAMRERLYNLFEERTPNTTFRGIDGFTIEPVTHVSYKDYRIFLAKNQFIETRSGREYGQRYVLVKGDFVFFMSLDFNKLLKHEKVIIDSSNEAEIAELYVKLTLPYKFEIKSIEKTEKKYMTDHYSDENQRPTYTAEVTIEIEKIIVRFSFCFKDNQISLARREVMENPYRGFLLPKIKQLPFGPEGQIMRWVPQQASRTRAKDIMIANSNSEVITFEEEIDEHGIPIVIFHSDKNVILKQDGIYDSEKATIHIVLDGFTPNSTVNLEFKSVSPNSTSISYPPSPLVINTNASGVGSVEHTLPSNFSTGKYSVYEIGDESNTTQHLFVYETITNPLISSTGYQSRIFYCAQFRDFNHTTISTFAGQMETVMSDVYNTIINSWNFDCPHSIDAQGDDYLDIYITLENSSFAERRTIGAILKAKCLGYGLIQHDDLMNPLSFNYSGDGSVMGTVLSHEFFHFTQFHYPHIFLQWNKRNFVSEGQAMCIQSVFSTDEFNLGNLYNNRANEFLTLGLNKSIKEFSYEYSLFWRFLYEKHLPGGTTSQKLQIFKDFLANAEGTNPVLVFKNIFNASLSSSSSFSPFDESLLAFAKNTYFNDSPYGNWDPNPAGFYDTPTIKSINTLSPNVKNNITENDTIPVSFGIDFHIVNIHPDVNAATFKLAKSGVNGASFAVQIWALQGTAIVDSFQVTLSETDTLAARSFVTKDKANQFVINLVRLDTNEADSLIDSTYTINVYPGTLVNGNQSGNWVIENSPYLLDGDVSVPAGQTLNIEAGVSVYALDHYGFTVMGTLNANGIEGARVVFSAIDEATGWRGIRFYPGSKNRTPSEFEYTTFEYAKNFEQDHYFDYAGYPLWGAGGAIFCFQSSPSFANCVFRNCESYAGAAMYLMNGSNVNLNNSEFYENTASDLGGAIAISNNYIFEGFSSTHTFRDLLIYNNTSGIYGGSAIYTNQNVELSAINLTVYNNFAPDNPYSTFYYGASFFVGAGSFFAFYDGILRSNQTAEVILWENSYDCFFGAANSNIKNGGACYAFVNPYRESNQERNTFFNNVIDAEPMFLDNNSFNLQQTSLCIDGGGSYDGALDPDGTLDDIGYGYYHQPLEVSQPSDITISFSMRNSLTLDWSQSNGAIFYKIFESDNPIDSFTMLDSIRADTFYNLEFDGSMKFYYVTGGNNRTRIQVRNHSKGKIDIKEIYNEMKNHFK
jgi:hypothetical protein